MAEYEPVVYGANAMKLTHTGGPSAVYENVTMTQTTAVERQDEPREERGGPGHDMPAMRKEGVASTIKVKVIALCVIGMLTLIAVGTALGIYFAVTSKQTMQLVEKLQSELQSMETRLNMSEETIKFLSATSQSLDRNLTENNQKLSFVETRMNRSDRQVDMVETRVIEIDASVSAVNSKINQNQQKLSSINITVRMVGDIASVNQQKLSSLNTTAQTTRNDLQKLNSAVFNSYHPVCPSSEYQYNPHSDSCYRVVKPGRNWNDSKDYCTASGEFFATFVTTESVEWFRYMTSIDAWGVGSVYLWVGGYGSLTGWKWTGRVTVPVDPSVWVHGEPHVNYCMFTRSAMFYIDPCRIVSYFMCETGQISD